MPHANELNQATCPVCNSTIESLGAGNVIAPFWHRIPGFFIYPARPVPLMVMLVILLMSLLVSGTVFGFLIQLASIIVFVKYAYVVLEQSAQGYLKPKPFSFNDFTQELELPFKQLIIIFAIYSVNNLVVSVLGGEVFSITLFFSIVCFPAIVMILAVEHELFRALNPVVIFKTISCIGLAYFILCVFLSLLMSGSWVLVELLSGVVHGDLILPAVGFVSMYFSLIMFHMMGYVIYQYHDKLGYQIEKEFVIDDESGEDKNTSKVFREFEILVQEGRLDEAGLKMQQLIMDRPNDLASRKKYHKFLLVTKDTSNLKKYAGEYILRLLHEGKSSRAMQVFFDARHIISDFKPDDAIQRFELAKLLASNGQARLALSLLGDLHRDFPNYADIPRAYHLVARLLCEQFNDDEKAKNILEFVINKYPAHPDIPSIKDYYQVINSLIRN